MKNRLIRDWAEVALQVAPIQQAQMLYFLLNQKDVNLEKLSAICCESENHLQAVLLENHLLRGKTLAALTQLTWDVMFPCAVD